MFLNGSEVLIIPIAAWPSELGLVRPVLRGLVLNLSGARANLDPPAGLRPPEPRLKVRRLYDSRAVGRLAPAGAGVDKSFYLTKAVECPLGTRVLNLNRSLRLSSLVNFLRV